MQGLGFILALAYPDQPGPVNTYIVAVEIQLQAKVQGLGISTSPIRMTVSH